MTDIKTLEKAEKEAIKWDLEKLTNIIVQLEKFLQENKQLANDAIDELNKIKEAIDELNKIKSIDPSINTHIDTSNQKINTHIGTSNQKLCKISENLTKTLSRNNDFPIIKNLFALFNDEKELQEVIDAVYDAQRNNPNNS